MNFTEHTGFADAASDELGNLRAKVENNNGLMLHGAVSSNAKSAGEKPAPIIENETP